MNNDCLFSIMLNMNLQRTCKFILINKTVKQLCDNYLWKISCYKYFHENYSNEYLIKKKYYKSFKLSAVVYIISMINYSKYDLTNELRFYKETISKNKYIFENVNRITLHDFFSFTISSEIFLFHNLKTLSIHNIFNISTEIGNLNNLEYLHLQNCNLLYLPSEIGNCINLKSLAINEKLLLNLPIEIYNLISFNKLQIIIYNSSVNITNILKIFVSKWGFKSEKLNIVPFDDETDVFITNIKIFVVSYKYSYYNTTFYLKKLK